MVPRPCIDSRLRSVYNHVKGLNRQEFLTLLVRAAVMRLVVPGHIDSVPAALVELLENDMIPRVKRVVPEVLLADKNDFRRDICYARETSEALSRHESTLRMIFDRYAQGEGRWSSASHLVGDELHALDLLGYDEWQKMMAELQLIDGQFADRDATWCFVSSRLRVRNESTTRGRAKLLQLSFEDFLEVWIRGGPLPHIPIAAPAAAGRVTHMN